MPLLLQHELLHHDIQFINVNKKRVVTMRARDDMKRAIGYQIGHLLTQFAWVEKVTVDANNKRALFQ